jgi:hypothetical protein
MPTPQNVKLEASINAGPPIQGPVAGGQSVVASDVVQLSVANTSGINKFRYEITDYPTGFALPPGWSQDAGTAAYYYDGATPPTFTIPASAAVWGRWLLRVIVNDAKRPGIDGTLVSAPDLIDETLGLQKASGSGLLDTPFLELAQFDEARQVAAAFKSNWRTLDGISPGGATGEANDIATVGTGQDIRVTKNGTTIEVRGPTGPTSGGILVANNGNNTEFTLRNHFRGSGDPNGSLSATLGDTYTDVATGNHWKNDGGTVWSPFGGSGESNDLSNQGSGQDIRLGKSGSTINIKGLLGPSLGGIITATNGNNVEFSLRYMKRGAGDPNGVVTGFGGDIYTDATAPYTLWRNTNGSSSWEAIGSVFDDSGLVARDGSRTYTGNHDVNDNDLQNIKTGTFGSASALGNVTGSFNVDLSTAQHFTCTLTGNATANLIAPPGVGSFQLEVTQGGGGPYTLGWSGLTTRAPGGTADVTATVGAVDNFSLKYNGTGVDIFPGLDLQAV